MLNCHGRLYLRSQLGFLHLYGWLPKVVEHRDRDPRNDRPSNLRAADQSPNAANTKRNSKNTTGVKGVQQCAFTGKFRVRVGGIEGGRFTDLASAAAVADKMGREIYGEFWFKGE